MPRAPSWTYLPTLAAVSAAAALTVSCTDLAAPATAARPPHRFITPPGACGGVDSPCEKPCVETRNCACDFAGDAADAGCVIDWKPPLPGEIPPDDGSPRLRITTAQGPNPERSFTTTPGERTLTLGAEVRPSSLAGTVTWRVLDDPTDGVTSAAPVGALPTGTVSAADLPSQSAARWQLPHGTVWTSKALAFKVVAEAANGAEAMPLRDSVVVRQREVDVLRQEYVDNTIAVPAVSTMRTAGDVVGLTRFTWAELNQGDYRFAVLTARLLQKLPELESKARFALTLNSVFRNPAHQRFHITGGSAKLSQHQYGTAVDLATYNNRERWDFLRSIAKSAGACVEPLKISKLHHVHADWRPEAPICPAGW